MFYHLELQPLEQTLSYQFEALTLLKANYFNASHPVFAFSQSHDPSGTCVVLTSWLKQIKWSHVFWCSSHQPNIADISFWKAYWSDIPILNIFKTDIVFFFVSIKQKSEKTRRSANIQSEKKNKYSLWFCSDIYWLDLLLRHVFHCFFTDKQHVLS